MPRHRHSPIIGADPRRPAILARGSDPASATYLRELSAAEVDAARRRGRGVVLLGLEIADDNEAAA